MPKILRIINRLSIGGPSYNVAYLSKYLSPEYETFILCGRPENGEASSEYIFEAMGLKPKYLEKMNRSISWKRDWECYLEIRDIIKDYKPDIVHTHAAKAGALGRLAASHEGVPVIVHTFHGHVFHSYFGTFKTRLFLAIERYLAKKSSRIIAISEKQRSELISDYKIASKEKFRIVKLGLDLDRFLRYDKKNSISNPEVIRVAIIGRLVPIKNHDFIIELIQKIEPRSGHKLQLVIVGDGELGSELKTYCRNLGLKLGSTLEDETADVLFTSWVRNMENFLNQVDIVVLCSKNEGTPLCLIEAGAAALPVVCTDVGGVRDVVVHEQTGFVVPSDDREAFSFFLKKMLDDPELRFTLGSAARKHIIANFAVKRLCDDMKKVYIELYSQL